MLEKTSTKCTCRLPSDPSGNKRDAMLFFSTDIIRNKGSNSCRFSTLVDSAKMIITLFVSKSTFTILIVKSKFHKLMNAKFRNPLLTPQGSYSSREIET